MTKPANGKSRSTKTKADEDADADVGKIREILFGAQMEAYDRRFASLESALERRVDAAIAQAEEKNEALREFAIAEFERISETAKREAADRVSAVRRLEETAKETIARLEGRIAELDEHLAKENAEIRQDVIETHNQVVSETKSPFNALDEVVQQATEELRDTKADRTELAGLFKSFAHTLSREFELPEVDT